MKKCCLSFFALLFALSLTVAAQSIFDLGDLSGNQHGYILTGASDFDAAGTVIDSGDFNGDGIRDLVICAPFADFNRGHTYIVYGKKVDLNKFFAFSSLDGTNGFTITGRSTGDESCASVATGDINGDGNDDIIVGAPFADGGGTSRGEAYVLFGSPSAPSTFFAWDDVDGNNGIQINGTTDNGRMGVSVATGDVNNDGFDDILIGAEFSSGGGSLRGEAHVILGKSSSFTTPIAIGGSTSSEILTINGESDGDFIGRSVTICDINNDDSDDIIIGSAIAPSEGTLRGAIHAAFGKETGFSSPINVSGLDGNNGFSLVGGNDFDQAGGSIGCGDINDDGFDDIIIGAEGASGGGILRGETYVFYGKSSGIPASTTLSNLNGGDGFPIAGINDFDQIGHRVTSGDVNGDGIDDIFISAPQANGGGTARGETYVVFGKNSGLGTSFNLYEIDGNNGLALLGPTDNERVGAAVHSTDINHDGFDDILIGSPSADGGGTGRGEILIFTNSNQQVISGTEGFRMLGGPVSGIIFNHLTANLWTEGATGSNDPSGEGNIWGWNQSSQNWILKTNLNTDTQPAGEGFLMYVFEDDNGPAEPGNGGFPKLISSVDSFFDINTDISPNIGAVSPVTGLDDGDFFLLSNPYDGSIDWDALSGWNRTNLSNTFYIYNNAASSYQAWNGTAGALGDGGIAPFQAFFVEGLGGSGSVSFDENVRLESDLPLIKQDPAGSTVLKLHAQAGSLGASAWVTFQNGAFTERDAYDGKVLASLADAYLELGTAVGEHVFQINALPLDQESELSFPLMIRGVSAGSVADFSIEGLEELTEWKVFIRDNETQELTEMLPETSIPLMVEPILAKEASAPVLPTPIPVKTKQSGSRYDLILTPGTSVSTEGQTDLPYEIHLLQNYPNPFNPVTQIDFRLPSDAFVDLRVYDLLGREVSLLLNRRLEAGSHQVTFDASSLPSGQYLYRLKTGGNIFSKVMTLIK